MSAAVHAVAAALIDSVRRRAAGETPTSLAALSAEHDELLVKAARFHRISPAVHVALLQATGRTVDALRDDHAEQQRRHLLALAELERLAPVLEASGVPWLTFKGPVLATNVYERPDLRWYNDLDVLVDPHGLGEVLAALENAGATLIDLNWRLIARDRRGELSLLLPHGMPLDLHWSLINEARIRRQIRLPVESMLHRRLRRRVGRTDVPTLEPHDRLIHLAVHAALSGGYRLLWLADMDRAFTLCDSDALLARAIETRTVLVVSAALERCARILGTPSLPVTQGRAWRAILRRVDAVRSPVLAFAGPSGQSIVRATRATTAASLAELGVQCGRYVRTRVTPRLSDNPLLTAVDGGERVRFLHLLEESTAD